MIENNSDINAKEERTVPFVINKADGTTQTTQIKLKARAEEENSSSSND